MNARKRVIGVAILTALAVIGDASLFIVLPIYWKDFGLTAVWQIGVLLSINRFIRLPINPLIGLFYKHFQLRTGIFISMFLAIITTFSYGVLHSFVLLVIMRALWGVAWSFLRLGGFLTVIEVASEANRGRFVGLYNGLWGLGGLVGMLGGGLLVDQTSIFFVTTLFAAIGVIGIPMIFFLVPVAQRTVEEPEQTELQTKKAFTPYVWMVLLTGLTMGFIVFGLFASTLSQLIERSYTTTWSIWDITIGAATIAGFIQAIRWGWDPFVASAVGRWLDIVKTQIHILFIPLIGGGILMFSMGFIQSIGLLIVLLLFFQLMSTIFVTTTDTLATNAAGRTNSIKVITAHTIVVDVGAALGPLMSYILIQYSGLTTVYVVAGILMMVLAIIWFRSMRKITR